MIFHILKLNTIKKEINSSERLKLGALFRNLCLVRFKYSIYSIMLNIIYYNPLKERYFNRIKHNIPP